MRLAVTHAAEAGAADREAIAHGVPPRALMQRAGAAAAAEIGRRYAERLARGVAVFAGPGNNGGDAWVVACGARVGRHRRARERGGRRPADRRTRARSGIRRSRPRRSSPCAATRRSRWTASSAPAPPASLAARRRTAVARIAALRSSGAAVVALDMPSGVDATTGAAAGAVVADLTLTFGTIKRGLLVARAHCGAIALLDIGLGAHAAGPADAPLLVTARHVEAGVPPIAADAHKGTRRKLAVVGGAEGMAGRGDARGTRGVGERRGHGAARR
jgi:NAD(P)H-hydrate epimerase